MMSGADLRAFLEQAADTFGDRTVSLAIKDESLCGSVVNVHVVLTRGEMWIADCGGTFLYLMTVGAPDMDEGAVRAVCSEHGTQFAISTRGQSWITRPLDDCESLTTALGEIEAASNALIMAAGIYGVGTGDPDTASPIACRDEGDS
jgi:hypothetical protein